MMEINRDNILAALGNVKTVAYYDDQGNLMGVYGRLMRLTWGVGEKKEKLCLWVTAAEGAVGHWILQIEFAHIKLIE